MKLYGEKLAAAIRKEMEDIQKRIDSRSRRISDGTTDYEDCYMSHRHDEEELSACKEKLDILQGDGTMKEDAIFDEDGKEVRVHWFDNRWGGVSCVARGVYASSIPALLKKTGWTQKEIRVPVWMKWRAGVGGGLCAAYTGGYYRCRWHTNMVTGEYVGYPE